MSTDEVQRQKENDVLQQKDVEFFAASVNAWYNTALEHDKSIFALSAGSIGLLVTLLTTVGVSSMMMLSFYMAAIGCFLICLAIIFFIFGRNRTHIEQIVSKQISGSDPLLVTLDIAAMCVFWTGVFFAAAIGITTAFSSYNKGKDMANEQQKQLSSCLTLAHDSFNGIATLQKSFSGVSNLQPQAVAQTPPAAVSQTSVPTAPVASQNGSGN